MVLDLLEAKLQQEIPVLFTLGWAEAPEAPSAPEAFVAPEAPKQTTEHDLMLIRCSTPI